MAKKNARYQKLVFLTAAQANDFKAAENRGEKFALAKVAELAQEKLEQVTGFNFNETQVTGRAELEAKTGGTSYLLKVNCGVKQITVADDAEEPRNGFSVSETIDYVSEGVKAQEPKAVAEKKFKDALQALKEAKEAYEAAGGDAETLVEGVFEAEEVPAAVPAVKKAPAKKKGK